MAVTSDRTTIPLGSESGRAQSIVVVPAQTASDKPGILAFEAVDNSGVRTRYFTWFDSNGSYRYHTSIPTDQDSDGSTITSGASAALSNLSGVAINTSLISDTDNTDDLGSSSIAWKRVYFGTSLINVGTTYDTTISVTEPAANRTITLGDPGGNDSVAYLAASQALTNKTYDGLTVSASSNTFTLTRGTATISLAEGNTDIALGAAAQLDIAAAKTVNIDQNLTVNTEAVTLNQSLSTTDDVTFAALTVTSVTDGTATLTAGGLTGLASLTVAGALAAGATVTCKGIVNTTTAIDSTANIQIGADNVYLTLGASDDSDSKVYFNATSLCFWDSDTATTYTLRQLATGTTLNPYVTGDLTIADGKFNWTDASAEAAAVWTFAGTTTTDIAIASSISTGTVLSITADSCANGKLAYLDADGGVGATGYYIYCYNGSAAKFTVGENGATVIGGNASGTDALTLTAGDILVTSGHIDITTGNLALANGQFTVATDTDSAHKIARNNATGTAPVLEIEETHTTGGTTLLVDSNATDGNDALQVTHDGTGYGLSVIGTAVTGKQALFQGPASQTASIVAIDGSTGSWIGAATTGMLHLTTDGALVADASCIRIASSGNISAANDGYALEIVETGNAQATSYAVRIASTNNEALHVDTGLSLFDERVTITLADNTGPALAVTNPDTTGNTNAVTIAPSGSGAGLYINPQETDTVGIKVEAKAASTVSQIVLDVATNNWSGAANVGVIHCAADAAFADVAASEIYLAASNAINDSRGHCLRIVDSSNVAGTMGYPAYITSNDATMGGLLITTHASGTALAVSAGNTDIDGPASFGSTFFLDGSPDTANAADSAISVTTSVTYIDTTIGACAGMTLADGTQGQVKLITMTVDNGDATVTPANPLGFATVKFTAIGQTALLVFLASKWRLIHAYGATIA
ncbi:MAG: hypothetical protein M0R06_02565 [Sphaerochaeta sp.]|nr:hypothetical protein [Sphaerochaeta sp.]